MLWRPKTYVPPTLTYCVCRVAISIERTQQQQRSRTPSGSPWHPLPAPCHPTRFFLDNLYFSSFIPCKTSFLAPLIPVSTALQWNFSVFYSPKKFNIKKLKSGPQKRHIERWNNSCRGYVKGDVRTILIPFLLTGISYFCYYFIFFCVGEKLSSEGTMPLGTLQNSLLLAGWDWNVPGKAAESWQLPLRNFWESHL